LRDNRDVMDKLAEHLIKEETITGKEFMKIFREAKGLPEPEEKKTQENDIAENKHDTDDLQITGEAEEKVNFEHTLDMVKSNADTEALKETSNACDGKLVINTDIQAPDYVAIGNEINSKVTGGNATWSFGIQDNSGTNMPENNKASEDMETDNKVSDDEASDNKAENKEISRFGSAWDQNINGGR